MNDNLAELKLLMSRAFARNVEAQLCDDCGHCDGCCPREDAEYDNANGED